MNFLSNQPKKHLQQKNYRAVSLRIESGHYEHTSVALRPCKGWGKSSGHVCKQCLHSTIDVVARVLRRFETAELVVVVFWGLCMPCGITVGYSLSQCATENLLAFPNCDKPFSFLSSGPFLHPQRMEQHWAVLPLCYNHFCLKLLHLRICIIRLSPVI